MHNVETSELVAELLERLDNVPELQDKEYFIVYIYIETDEIAVMLKDKYKNQIYTFNIGDIKH